MIRLIARALILLLLFGAAVLAQPPSNVSVTPASGSGVGPQTFAVTASSPNGYSYLQWLQVMFNYGIDGGGACYLYYYAPANVIYMSNDNGVGWVASAVLGGSGVIQNSQCSLALGASSYSGSGTTGTLRLALTFKSGLPGPQNIYMSAGDVAGASSSWQQMGTWTTSTVSPQPPSLVSVTPGAGGALAQTFSYTVSSVNGYTYIAQMSALINTTSNGVSACHINYNRPGNYVILFDDSGGWAQPGYLGTAGTVHNSQCTLDTGASYASGSGNNLTLNLALTFNSAWAGAKNNYLWVLDRGNNTAGWQQMGTWTVSAPVLPTMTSLSPVSQTGLSQVFTATYGDINGYQDISEADLSFQTGTSTTSACSVKWVAGSGFLLMNDAATAWSAPVAAGSNATVQNSQCLLSGAVSSASGSGASLTVNFGLTFFTGFSGSKNVLMQAVGGGGRVGWQQMGTWTVGVVSQPPSNVSVMPASGSGMGPQTFAFTASSPNGYSYLQWLQAIFNYGVDGGGACYLYYYAPANVIYMSNDNGVGWVASAVLGGSGVIQNSQCSLALGASSYSGSGPAGTLRLAVTFKSGLPGPQNIYMSAGDINGAGSSWQQMGTWTTSTVSPQPPTLVSLTPSAGGALAQTFSYTVSSINGYTYIAQMDALINATNSGVGACFINYNRLGNYVILFSDTGGWAQPGYLGTAGTVHNSQCTLDTGASYASGSGNNLTLNLALTFNSSWGGAKNNYLWVWDRGNNTAGWQQMGTWTVGTAPPSNFSLTAPANGAINQSVTPNLTWASSTGATAYDVYLGNGTPVLIASNVSTNSYTVSPALAPSTTYSWYVVAKNSSGTTTSPTWTFTTSVPDFTVSLTSSSPTVLVGDTLRSASYTITVSPVNGFNQNVTLSVTGAPTGSTTTFSPGILSPSGITTLIIRVPPLTSARNYPLLISATAGTITRTIQSAILSVQDYSITVLPSSLSLGCSGASSFTVQLNSLNGFSGSVTLGEGSMPYGVTAGPNGSPVLSVDSNTPNASQTFHVNSFLSANCAGSANNQIQLIGTYTIGAGVTATRYATEFLGINTGPAAVGSVSVSPSPTVMSGGAATVTVNLTSPAPAGGILVGLTSSETNSFPSGALVIPQGASSASIQMTAAVVASTRWVTLTASYGNGSTSTTFNIAPPALHLLTTAISPPGTGTVNPSGGSFGSPLMISATPASGYQFTGFSANGAVYSTNPAYIPMTGPTTVTATFAPVTATPLMLSDGTPQPTVIANNQPQSVQYSVSQGDARTVDRCTTADGNLTAQATANGSATLTITFVANSAISNGSVPVSCHWISNGGEGGIGLPPARVVHRHLEPAPDPGDPGPGGACVPISCPALSQDFTALNNGQPVTWTYYTQCGDASLNHDCHYSINGIADSSIVVQPTITYPSQRTSCSAAFDVTLSATPAAAPGPRTSLNCQYGNEGSIGWMGGTALTVIDGTPHITSVSPPYGYPGQTEDLAIAGSQLDGVTAIAISGPVSGSVCPGQSCPLSPKITSVASDSVTVSLSIDPKAKSGTYLIGVTSYNVGSPETVQFMVGDSSPVINYITQPPLQPGQPGSISLYGANFGTGCGNNLPCAGAKVAVCKSADTTCTASDVTPSVTYWSDAQINVNVNPASSASGSYDAQVTSAGAAGLGFAPAQTPVGPTSQASNRKSFTVNANSNVSLQLTSAGQVVPAITDQNRNTTQSCAWIDETPTMPNITVQAVNADGSKTPVPGKVWYQLMTFWKWTNRDPSIDNSPTWQEDANRMVPGSSPAQFDASATWTIPWPSNCGTYGIAPCFFGGYATIYWWYSPDGQQTAQSQQPFNFYICGRNPSFPAVLQYMYSAMPNATQYWFAEKLAWHETGMSQFCESGRMDTDYCASSKNHMGWPVFGPPAGYGLLQRDPLPGGGWEMPSQIMWNWQDAIDSGKVEIDTKAGPAVYNGNINTPDNHLQAYPFWIRQVKQWNEYNSNPNLPVSQRVDPPQDVIYGGCTFTLPLTTAWDSSKSSQGLVTPLEVPLPIPSDQQPQFTVWFGDAILIKRFNGAPVDYIAWQNDPRRYPVPSWGTTPQNSTSKDTVQEVCSCYGPPKYCLPTIKPY